MSFFFINRPVFAWVIAILIMLAGVIAIKKLPIEQYPSISAPYISINTNYPGASASMLENSVTQVIERTLTGIDNTRYIKSSSDSAGNVSVGIIFEPGTNADLAQIQVQNKVQTAIPLLPQEVQKSGVSVTKGNSGFLLVAGFYSDNPAISQIDLGDMLNSQIKDGVARVNGVGGVTVFGNLKAMRIWLNPHKLHEYNLTVGEVKKALKVQNSDISAGYLGGAPSTSGQQLNISITGQSRLQTVDDFEKIILRVNSDGSQVRLKNIAKVELGSSNYETIVRYKRKPAAGIGITLATGANALDTADAVKEKIDELMHFLPKDIKLLYPYDNTPFIVLAIKDVVMTLLEAALLVFLVMFLFLQNFRATIIPAIAVPVVLLGTFAMLYLFGFTINVLTMFAMVLAIGLLVDDAIVVVENVERVIHEEGLSARDATVKSMRQITGALIGIGLVLSAVFIPMMFFGGAAGEIYKQFAFTIVCAMGFSILVALTLSSSLCAQILGQQKKEWMFFKKFNEYFDLVRDRFLTISRVVMHNSKKYLLIYIFIVVGLVALFQKIPKSFLPDEDQGMMMIMMSTAPGATLERTLEQVKKVENYFLNNENDTIKHMFTVTGRSFTSVAQNVALGFVGLKDWQDRTTKEQSVFNLANRSMGALMKIKDVSAFAFYPPPIPELGNSSGFDLQLVDVNGVGHKQMMQAQNEFLAIASKSPKLVGVRPNGLADVPQIKIIIDHEKASSLGLGIAEINDNLQTAWGSEYVNHFIDKGRIKSVYIQSDAKYRMMPEDISHWYVRNNKNEMVPLDSIARFKWTYGSPKLERFNGRKTLNINGSAAPGVSTGESMKEIEKIVKSLPIKIGYEWSGLSYEEKESASQTTALYFMSVLAIFLCLAALYESWTIPFSVMLSVPLGLIGIVLAALIFKMSNDIYFQIALLTTIGLTAKNGILIVEFAKELKEKGMRIEDAILKAAKLRFRPIIMTSMAFVLGVLPLACSTGIGSGSQRAIGISVIGGMLSATFIAILFVPMFYLIVSRLKK